MASTFKAVTDTMEDLQITCWKAYSRGGSLLGYYSEKSGGVESSINRLRKLLEQQLGEFVKVELLPTTKAKQGGDFTKVIKMEVDLNSLRGTPTVVSGHTPSEDIVQLRKMLTEATNTIMRLNTDLIEQKYTNKIAELEKRIEGGTELSVTDKMLAEVIPLIPGGIAALITYFNKPRQEINGLPGDDLLARLIKVDADGYRVLVAIVDIAENHTDVYKTFKPMILNYGS
jgi:hypothetical protein